MIFWDYESYIIQILIGTTINTAGAIFADSNLEQWCSYFPIGLGGFPFTVYYKECEQILTAEAMVIIDEFLFNLHSYNEFPGWKAAFSLNYRSTKGTHSNSLQVLGKEPFLLRRRQLSYFNHPKSYTLITE